MTDNRTTELLQELRDLAEDVNPSEIVDHVSITRMGWTFDAQWLDSWHAEFDRMADELEQAIAATLGMPKAKAHPYGYEPDTGAFDVTRCECGCINDISATYCNDCGGVIEIDMNAEKEIYHTLRHIVFAEKHDDGSLELGGKRYIAATPGGQPAKLTAEQVRETVEKHWHDLPAEYDMPEATALPEYSYDWQAIADELNACAERTCRCTTDDNAWCFACSECGKSFPRSRLHYAYNHGEINYCPNCGAKVVGE